MKKLIAIITLCVAVSAYSADVILYSTQPSQTLSATTTVVNAGVYAATDLATVDPDLAAPNIASTSTIFGVVGTRYAPVAKTGQLSTYGADDDGALRKGLAWPATRFTVQANTNCVTDNLTGLIWARNANQFGTVTWSNALSSCNNLNYGGQTDWRLPNLKELLSLIDYANSGPALPSDNHFAGVQSGLYWSSTTLAGDTSHAWYVYLGDGNMSYDVKDGDSYYVWPVRGGQ